MALRMTGLASRISENFRRNAGTVTSPWAQIWPLITGLCPPASNLSFRGPLTSPDGELLFWVPFGNQLGLLRPGTLNVFGTAVTRVDFERSAHGAEWTHCRRQSL